jgi:hypothetical protein
MRTIESKYGVDVPEEKERLRCHAVAQREECKVRASALIFSGLAYIHPALRRYNDTWVVVDRQGDRLIVSDGLGKTICELEVYE